MLVSLSGQKRSGKDTVADILVKQFKFTKIALADPLRDICSRVFDIPTSTFLDDTLKEKQFERPIFLNEDMLGYIMAIVENEWEFDVSKSKAAAMSDFLGCGFAHPRQLLQIVGTEIIRGCIDDNIFLELANRRIDKIDGNVVVSDVRFAVEQEWARNKGALMCLIKRPSLTLSQDTHASENQLGEDTGYTVIMTNDAQLSIFKHDVHSYFSHKLRST